MRAINDGDRATATNVARQVLAVESGNSGAEELLDSPARSGEMRRLTVMFTDLVNSTALSTRLEPEEYHTLVGRYRRQVVGIVAHHEGHVAEVKGDGLLAIFGHPKAHENDVRRAVAAGLDITRALSDLSGHAQRMFGVSIDVRIGIHRGSVYLDTARDDVDGFIANLAARLSALASPGTVTVSDAVARLISGAYELAPCTPAPVKGIVGLVTHHRVVGEMPPAPPQRRLPLVGRDTERAWLQRSWQLACEGSLPMAGVGLRGEPGIGKTRLAAEAIQVVAESGAPVIELIGSPQHTDAGMHPVRTLLEQRCGITRLTDATERLRLLEDELRRCAMDPTQAVPALAPVLGVGPEHGYQPAAAASLTLYELIGATVRQYLAACLGGGPGLIVAEDVHWFDPTSLELLSALLREADGHLLIVVTGRDGPWYRNDWPMWLFDLEPLTNAQSDVLIDALDPDVTDAQRAAVRKRCDGLPFYIEHVVGELNTAQPRSRVPEALYEPLFARIHHLHADVVPVVEAAALIGRSGDLALLRAVACSNTSEVDAVVTELVGARVLERIGSDGWRFRHELFREVAAELAPPSVRRELHERTARALVDAAVAAEPDWPVVADHFKRADRNGDAVAAYQNASIDARLRGALNEARSCLDNAVDLLARLPEGADRDRREIAIRLERGFLAGLSDGGTSGGMPADFERCLQLAGDVMGEDELFLVLTALVGYYVPRAELARAHELLLTLSRRVTRDRKWSHPVISSSLGTVLWLGGDFDAAQGHLLAALAHRSVADPRELQTAWWVATDPIAVAHIYLALTHLVRGDLDRAEADLDEALSRSNSLGYPQNAFNRAMTYFTQIWICMETGRFAESAELVAALRLESNESGLDLMRMVGATENATVKAMAALDRGATPSTLIACAENLIRRVDGSRLLHLNVYLTFHDAVIGRLLIAADQHDCARDRLDMSLTHAKETGMHFHDAELMRLRAHTFPDHPRRREALAAALGVARSQRATLFELRCLLDWFDLLGVVDRAELADVASRFSDDMRWPERARAERILT